MAFNPFNITRTYFYIYRKCGIMYHYFNEAMLKLASKNSFSSQYFSFNNYNSVIKYTALQLAIFLGETTCFNSTFISKDENLKTKENYNLLKQSAFFTISTILDSVLGITAFKTRLTINYIALPLAAALGMSALATPTFVAAFSFAASYVASCPLQIMGEFCSALVISAADKFNQSNNILEIWDDIKEFNFTESLIYNAPFLGSNVTQTLLRVKGEPIQKSIEKSTKESYEYIDSTPPSTEIDWNRGATPGEVVGTAKEFCRTLLG